MYKRSFKEYSNKLYESLLSIDEDKINQLLEEISIRMDGHSSIYFMGNGGSAANASHICGDYLKTFTILNQKLKIFNLTDSTSYYTATVNDIDQCDVFSILVGKLIQKDDLLILLSGSGNSINLVKAAQKAKNLGIKLTSVTAYTGGALYKIADIPIHIFTNDMEIAEDGQLSIFHHIKQHISGLIENRKNLDDEFNISKKYLKRVNNDQIA